MVAGPDGGATSAPAACSSAEGRIDVVVRGPDLGYYYTWAVSSELYLVADTPPLSWAPWQALGGTFTSKPGVASYGDGAIDVVGRALDGSVLRSHCASGGAFGPWTTIDDGPAFSAPAACCTAPGELDVFWSARVLPYFESPLAHPLVTPGDIPVYRDYDADGRPDFGAWRPSTGEWLVIYS